MLEIVFAILLFGLLGSTWLFPALAAALKLSSTARQSGQRSDRPCSLLVFIPAHNEQSQIGATISSVQSAVQHAINCGVISSAQIVVSANRCSDQTATIARQLGATVLNDQSAETKWDSLKTVTTLNESHTWTAFVDCGSVWPSTLISDVASELSNERVVGIAPTYGNPRGGILEQLVWAIERHFKLLENYSGGPISVHGATVLYRSPALKSALSHLEGRSWLNDDVVIPLMVRTLFPENVIRYITAACVADSGITEPTSATQLGNRRMRMMAGNIEWIQHILPLVFKKNPVAGLVALRRIFRTLWAYWAILGSACCAALVAQYSAALFVGVMATLVSAFALVRRKKSVSTVAAALRASVYAPFRIVNSTDSHGVVWR